ncbi:MAG TPA: peptide deformylase [Candidatus Portnoybacteria bacterium]|uniref:Peptide deformylase n=1 Tax=Candidatus Portnoybacteria bacterium CG02_land_8_20_14_3_00_45_8 TaxID=1974807 RepID=A0A2M7D6J0_9BACT|nr:MAG: peptide deformylase [Candidatus Portnoybacteria bacterium CG02_land_8_20_14_3_00_45_8]HCX27795.1 peptide deformylase [Candidatus Portnoybacteria bacterium]
MILDIKIYPARVLIKKTKRVGEIDADTKKLIDDMVETLYVNKGAGLAANQVGASKQVIVADDGSGLLVLINPKITQKKGAAILVEGCLSFPGLEIEVKRPTKIEVEYKDKNGQHRKTKAQHLLARIICHEIDHLNGKTLLDKLSLFERLKVKRQLRKAAK